MRLAVPIAIIALAVALLSGCGGSGEDSGSGSTDTAEVSGSSGAPAGAAAHACALDAAGTSALRATAVSCGDAQRLALAWHRNGACAPPAGASRAACTVRSYRCLATVTGRGLSVSCARPNRSVAFLADR